MTTRTRKRPAKTVRRVTLPADLTISTAADTKTMLMEMVEQNGDLELDCTAVEELDTAGLQVLLLARRELTVRGNQLTMIDVPSGIRSVLAVVGLDAALDRLHVVTTGAAGATSEGATS